MNEAEIGRAKQVEMARRIKFRARRATMEELAEEARQRRLEAAKHDLKAMYAPAGEQDTLGAGPAQDYQGGAVPTRVAL